MTFEVTYLQDALDFLKTLEEKEKKKVLFNIERAKLDLDDTLLSKLNDNIWEFRTFYNKKKIRLLCFWDTDKKALIVATNGFIKKTKKTPKLEIQKAENLREQYFKENCGQK